jgi:hypothetical protein
MFLFNDLKMKKKIYHTVITVSKSYSKSENQRLKSILLMLIAHVPGLGTDHLTWRGGVWFFVWFRNFFSDNTRVRIFIFFVAQSANFFSRIQHYVIWQKLWIRLFFFPTSISEYFVQQHWESEYLFRKKP